MYRWWGSPERAQVYNSSQAPCDAHLCLKLRFSQCTKINVKRKYLVNQLVLCVPVNLNNTKTKMFIDSKKTNKTKRQIHLSRGSTSII